MHFIKQFSGKKILEIGNVISHYYLTNWDILDKFEQSNGIINEDVENFKPQKKYDLIISISTFEHVGYDDDIVDPRKITRVLNNFKHNCLNKKDMILFTTPIGYNKDFNELIFKNKIKLDAVSFLKAHRSIINGKKQ